MKRFMDIVLSIIAAAVFMPLLLIAALAVKLDSEGPVLFRQERIGRDGKTFRIYKFRTMIQGAECMGDGLFNYEDDFRVTRVGRILRKTSLDEAPQLINILRGEMSVVGPRPPVTYEHGNYENYPEAWKKRFTVRPGVTGLAQVSGRNELSWEEKIKLDDEYIGLFERYGVLIDIRIIAQTVGRVFSMASTYERRENEMKEKSGFAGPVSGGENRLIWLNGKLLPAKDAMISVLSPSAQFGANVFEGIRCYWNGEKQALYAFRLDDHYARLKNSVRMFRMEDGYSVSEMRLAFTEAVKANGYREDIAVRQTIFLDGTGSWSAGGPVGMFVAPVPKGRAFPGREGLNCCVSSYQRISDRDLSPRIKMGANYINSRFAQLEAARNGCDTAIFLNASGTVSEAPGSCVFVVRNGRLATPPCTASVLESITRDTVMKIAEKRLGANSEEREISRAELYVADEVFLCGTSMEIVPVLSIDGLPVGKGKPGELTEKLFTAYMDAVRGKDGGFAEWLTEIY